MKNQLVISVLIVVLVILFGFLVADTTFTEEVKVEDDIAMFSPEEVIVDFLYSEDGLHNYSGTIEFPNSCYELFTEAVVQESFPEHITLMFNAFGPDADTMCAQVITPKTFRLIVGASELATVSATYNGEDIDLIIVSNSDTTQ